MKPGHLGGMSLLKRPKHFAGQLSSQLFLSPARLAHPSRLPEGLARVDGVLAELLLDAQQLR